MEVNVTSFVIDGELFYTGVISELVPKNAQGRSRGTSVSTMGSENHECTMKQKVWLPLYWGEEGGGGGLAACHVMILWCVCVQAMAVGAQMKIAHKLKSAEHITQKELENILASSLAASKIEVGSPEREQQHCPPTTNDLIVHLVNFIPLALRYKNTSWRK